MYIFKRLTKRSNYTVSYGFLTFYVKRDPFHTNSCLRGETRSVIVLFHMTSLKIKVNINVSRKLFGTM